MRLGQVIKSRKLGMEVWVAIYSIGDVLIEKTTHMSEFGARNWLRRRGV